MYSKEILNFSFPRSSFSVLDFVLGMLCITERVEQMEKKINVPQMDMEVESTHFFF